MAPDFKSIQADFTGRIRYGDDKPLPVGVSEQRMQVYQELLFNNVYSVFERCFPVIFSLLSQQQSKEMVHDFLCNSHCQTPYFHHLPYELVCYLSRVKLENYPYLAQLADYEWLELEVELSDDSIQEQYDSTLELNSSVVFSSTIRIKQYDYEVEKINKNYQPKLHQSSYLLLYRNENDEVKFVKLNEMSFYLIELLSSGNSIEVACKKTHIKFSDIEYKLIMTGAIELIQNWYELGFVIGFKKDHIITNKLDVS